MADSESPAPRPKRKGYTQATTFFDAEEMAEMILDELEKSREGIDIRLAKYNDSILQAQTKKRQRFIDYCESEIGGLPERHRSSLATRLLSSEDFSVKMNFSELHTSSAKSHLTWSCGDASLSDPSWKKLLQQFAKGAAEAAPPSTGELARSSLASRKGPSLPARVSLPIGRPARPSTSTALAGDDGDPFAVSEDQDPLSFPGVTISKTRGTANIRRQVRPPGHEAQPRKGPPGSFGEGATSKGRGPNYYWTQQEMDKLKSLCVGKPDARRTAQCAFWKSVEAKMPGRSGQACRSKWTTMPEAKSKPEPRKRDGYAVNPKRRPWSREELKLLDQAQPRPGESIDWVRARALFPDRTSSSIGSALRHRFRARQTRSEAHRSGGRPAAADEVGEESAEGDGADRDDENGTETGSNGGSQ